MIKDIEMFMELDSQYEEMRVVAETYAEVADVAYSKAAMCIEEGNPIAYGVWMDVVEMCNFYLDDVYGDIERIKEKLQDIVEEV